MASTNRPDPWENPDPEHCHFEAVEAGPEWREGGSGRRCRFTLEGRRTCRAPAVARLDRGKRVHGQRQPMWWHYCGDHLYGRWIEDGKVMQWRLVENEES